MNSPLVYKDDYGLYCPAGNFHIDAWRPVGTNLVTHAHADHATSGHVVVWGAERSVPILRHRLGKEQKIESLKYGEKRKFGNAWVSFHSAGHILGSAQIRIEVDSEVWVFTGDYKRTPDPSCDPFEVVPCDTLITEATFALPIYHWRPTSEVATEIAAWWDRNQREGVTSILLCYALGKAQRVLAELGQQIPDPILLHGTMMRLTEIYREAGIELPPTAPAIDFDKATLKREGVRAPLVLAPPSAFRSTWAKRFGDSRFAFASGWMNVRGVRRRRGYDRGFVVSDHADWNELIQTVKDTHAKNVLVTHGVSDTLVRYLQEFLNVNAQPLETPFGDEAEGEKG